MVRVPVAGKEQRDEEVRSEVHQIGAVAEVLELREELFPVAVADEVPCRVEHLVLYRVKMEMLISDVWELSA